MSIFGRSAEELDRLRAAVRMLGTTSVPGLSAALSWREHKTEKLLAQELARPGTFVVYEPAQRVVRWFQPPPPPVVPPNPPTPEERATPPREGPSLPPVRAAPAVLKGASLKAVCPTCHVALLSTGSANLAVCPECGRLSSERTVEASAPAPGPTPPPAPDGGSRAPTALTDRRSQEMFAAYVGYRPIPCPKCRTPLRHRGVSEYGCPTCGQLIRFPGPAGPGAVVTAPPLSQH
jgi:predicted RNA-binding Zn-ribbon protein involved in translation (DUF1610 family)